MDKTVRIDTKGVSYSHSVEDCAKREMLATRHCHDNYEILYVASGNGRYILEGSEFPLYPRTLVIIKPFEYHYVEIDKNVIYERYVVNFNLMGLSRETVAMLEKILGESSDKNGCFYRPGSISTKMASIFDRFEYANELPENERNIYVKLLLSEIILFLSVSSGQHIIRDEAELGAKVIRYINEYLDKKLTLDILARKFFISKYYLCRAFKEYSGVSIHSYINHKRVIYAKQLMDEGETASGAAYKVGFGDYSAFYRAYVKIVGAPPTVESRKKEPKTSSAQEPLEG